MIQIKAEYLLAMFVATILMGMAGQAYFFKYETPCIPETGYKEVKKKEIQNE